MPQITKSITVDVAKRNLFQAIVAKQHDNNSRFLKATFANEGEVINIDASSVVMINARRADGASKPFAGVTNTDGTVTVPLTDWMLALDDRVVCDISVVDADGNKLTSTSFELEVEAVSHNGEVIEGDENYDLLVALLAEVSDMKNTLVFTERTIADIDLSKNISVEQLQSALKAHPFKIFTTTPTTSDVGKVGQFGGKIYYSSTSGTYQVDLYLCCSAGKTEGTYQWVLINNNTISDSQIASALSAYLEEHPIEGTGADGEDGVGIETTQINSNGELVLTYTDGMVETVGKVVGADGKDGADGNDGINGQDGKDGEDGYSPKITVSETDTGYDFTIEHSENFVENISINHGIDGKNGADGKDGEDGQDGYTPVRGVDYWTDEDKAEIKAYIDEAFLGGAW